MMIRNAAVLLLCAFPSLVAHASAWTSHGPAGGSTRSLVEARGNPNILYVASSGGVFRSDDGGAHWHTITGPVLDPVELAIAPSNPDVAIAASGVSRLLYRTDDGGATWRVIGDGLPPSPDVSTLAFDPRDTNVVYAGTRCGAIFGSGPIVQWHEAAGLFKSVDGGETFIESSSGMTGFQLCVEELSVDPLNPDTLYATPVYPDTGWARSDDAGVTWQTVPDRAPVPGGSVVYDPHNPAVGFGTTMGSVLLSTDGGKHWSRRQPTNLETGRFAQFGSLNTIALDPSVPRLFIGSQDGTYRTGDAATSVLPLDGPARERTSGIGFNGATGSLTIGTASGVYQSAGFPWDQWQLLATGDLSRPMLSVLPSRRDPHTVFASTATEVFVSRDDGLTWLRYAESLPRYEVGEMRFEAIDANDTIYAVGRNDDGTETLFRRPLGSNAWTPIPPPFFRSIHAVYVNDDEPAVVYARTFDTTFRSTDSGTTWEATTPRVPAMERASGQPVISRSDPNVVYVGGRDATLDFVLYRSTDGGQTWTALAVPEGVQVLTIAVDPRTSSTVYISSYAGTVHRSRDGGTTWTSLTGNLPSVAQRIALNLDGSILHAASERGMWERSVGASRRRPVAPAANQP